MYIKPIQQLQGLNELNKINDKTKDKENELSFKNIFNDALSNYTNAEKKVDEDIYKLSIGESDDLHNLMINTQKAEMSLDLFLQLRNKALDAYSEIMRFSV